jgi:chlorophyllase
MKLSKVTPLFVATLLLVGCGNNTPCVEQEAVIQGGALPATPETPYRQGGNPYEPGPLTVRTVTLDRCQNGAPVPLLIHIPEQSGTYAVVVFQHGFMSRNAMYGEILRHIAGHGFVVVAPQMYEPGLGPLFGNPTAAEEADRAAQVLDWVSVHLAENAGVGVRPDLLGLAGHSRGGKVAWLVLSVDPTRAKAVAGVDPVDGTGGPVGNQARVVQGTFPFSIPALVIGTGLGGACAPEGDNHVQFYGACRSPAWHVVAFDYGHGDVLDDEWAAASAMVCASGSDLANMRRLTAGLLVAFFRGSLQGDEQAYHFLTDTGAAPSRIGVEAK